MEALGVLTASPTDSESLSPAALVLWVAVKVPGGCPRSLGTSCSPGHDDVSFDDSVGLVHC